MKLAIAITIAYSTTLLAFGAPVLHEVCQVMLSIGGR
jgi:hypothetical protein